MSSPSNVIDLPVSPLRSTVAEGNLLNAPVAATLMNGKTVTGRLVGLDGPQAVLTLHSSEKGRSIIRFSELRQLNFINKHPTNTGKHPLEAHAGDVSMPRAVEDFHVIFSDGRTLSGRTRGSFVDDIGLHLFQLAGSAYISRIFIPSQVVKKYNIGDNKPATVHKHAAKTSKAGAAAGAHKPAMKRRKTDNKTSGLAVNSVQLEEAIERQTGRPADNLLGSKQIGSMLVDANIITPEQLDAALKAQQQDRSQKLGEILVRMGTVSAHDIYRTLAHKFGLPFVLLRNFYIDLECLSLVPADVAHKYALVPLVLHQNRLVVAMDDPANTEAITLLRFITRYNIEPTIATKEDISWAIAKYYGGSSATNPAVSKPGPAAAGTIETPRLGAADSTAAADSEQPIISFVDNTILDAIQRNAADIHMVPKRDYVELLFRIDGALIPIRRFSKVLYPKIMDQLKTMGGMDPAETRQHARASIASDDLIYDLRIAMMPGADGTDTVIHLFNTNARLRTLRDLGLSTREEYVLMEELNKTYSMILVTGPEGSDKTATLYAALLALKTQNLRILTLEDPVGHHLAGIDQRQLNRRAGATFAGMIKTLDLRHTDVVMFGEIRDAATANCAIDTALGKHLVLGKMHADNSADAVMALIRMGIEPRRLKGSLPCVIAQRALRLNCSHCLEVEEVAPEIRQALGVTADEVFYRSKGCPRCNHTGFQGRSIVYELLEMTAEIYALLENKASVADLRQQAVKNGMITLMEGALSQARLRSVSLTEVYQNG